MSEIPDRRCSSRDQRDSARIRPWEWKPTHTVLSAQPPVRLSWSLPNASAGNILKAHTRVFKHRATCWASLAGNGSNRRNYTREVSLLILWPFLPLSIRGKLRGASWLLEIKFKFSCSPLSKPDLASILTPIGAPREMQICKFSKSQLWFMGFC